LIIRSATATTDKMQGLMDLQIDLISKRAKITEVIFDEVGGVDVQGSIKRRVEDDDNASEQSKFK
jgi:hypothetical protein